MHCIICGGNKFKVIRKKLRYDIKRDVLQCSRCGFIFLKPIDEDAKKNYASKAYRAKYGPSLKKVSNSREIFNAYFPFQGDSIKEIDHILKPGMSMLDVGCSTGHFLYALKGRVKKRVGVELSKDAAKFIKKNLDFKVYSEPIEALNMKESPFDLVTSMAVLEHIEDPLSFLKQLAKNLKPQGHLYLEVPNIDDALISCYGITGYTDFYYREPHVSYFSRKTLELLLKKAGFVGKIKTVQRYNFLNHMHWLLTGRPQDNFAAGNGAPKLVANKNASKPVANDLNSFIAKTDLEYKEILAKHNLGETLVFLGKKVDKK